MAYIKPAEPSFLKSFKEKVGYKEPANIGEPLFIATFRKISKLDVF